MKTWIVKYGEMVMVYREGVEEARRDFTDVVTLANAPPSPGP